MSAAPAGRSAEPRILTIVFVTIFMDLVGFGILIPIQPFYAEYFGARPTTVTLLSASFSIVQFLFAPAVGRLSDHVGRRPVMLATIAINAAGYLVFGLAGSLAMLFAARIVCGFGSANLGTAQAIVADITSPETRARGMGVIGAAFGLGFIFGPAIGGFLGQYGLAMPGLAAAALSAVNFVLALFILPETRPAGVPPRAARWRLSLPALREAAAHPTVRQLFWIYLIGTFAFSLMEQVLGLFIERAWVPHVPGETAAEHLREAAAMTAWFLVVVGVTATAVQGVLIGRLARRFGERRLLQAGTLLITLSLILIPIVGATGSYAVFLGIGPLLAAGSGLTNPALPSLLSRSVAGDAYGETLGLGQSLSALGRVLGPTVAGALFEVSPAAPFWMGAALAATCVGRAMKLRVESSQEFAIDS
jgi:multidrug resistance protein